MGFTDDDIYGINAREHNLISPGELSTIRIKLGKSHRKESDWTVIKDILYARNVICMEPAGPDSLLKAKDHILCENNVLFVFTNTKEACAYIQELNARHLAPGRLFQVGSIPFVQAAAAADHYRMNLYIDMKSDGRERFMVYYPGEKEIRAVLLAKI